MSYRAAVLTVLAVALAGCSSASLRFDSRGVSFADRSEVIRQFPDGSGVARLVVAEDGERVVATAIASDVRRLPPDAAAPAIRNVRIVGTTPFGNLFTGNAVVNGVPVEVTGHLDAEGHTFIHHAQGRRVNQLVAGGGPVRSIPRGSFTYRGANFIGNADGTNIEQGSFRMDVNFDTRRAALTGSTPNTSISDPRIVVNTATGTFASSEMTIRVDGRARSGSIDGNFHGQGAVGVTGVYHDNARTPELAGAIAGTR